MATKKVTKDKFKTNKFAKKYKTELDMADAIESANQIKSWNRYGQPMTIPPMAVVVAFILGFVVCAIITSWL